MYKYLPLLGTSLFPITVRSILESTSLFRHYPCNIKTFSLLFPTIATSILEFMPFFRHMDLCHYQKLCSFLSLLGILWNPCHYSRDMRMCVTVGNFIVSYDCRELFRIHVVIWEIYRYVPLSIIFFVSCHYQEYF